MSDRLGHDTNVHQGSQSPSPHLSASEEMLVIHCDHGPLHVLPCKLIKIKRLQVLRF